MTSQNVSSPLLRFGFELEEFAREIGNAAGLLETYQKQEPTAGALMVGALAAGACREAAHDVAIQVATDPALISRINEFGGRRLGAWQYLQNVSDWFGEDTALAMAEQRLDILRSGGGADG